MRKLKVMFLCTGNACRSQMAEGWARHLRGDVIDACSAGVHPHGMNPRAVAAMAEAGVDIAGQWSKHVDDLRSVPFDYVVTVCGHANETCPTFPGGTKVVHVPFDDPPKLAANANTVDEAMPHYRRVRDEIRAWVETLPASLERAAATRDPATTRKDRPMTRSLNQASDCCGPTCCGDDKSTVTASVQKAYGAVAASALSNDNAGTRAVAEAFGYTPAQLAAIPAEANMGLSCGNPTATANLRPGEVVVDLGSGGGLDVFLAAEKVGPTGRAIGVDMTPAMIERAHRNAAGYANVEFRLGEIDALPLPDAVANVVISNCVINLAPDKRAVFREIARVLKPGGRVAISDIVLTAPLPRELADNAAAWCGCIAGAVPAQEYLDGLRDAGLTNVVAVDDHADLNAYAKAEGQAACCAPAPAASSSTLPVASAGCCGSETAPAMHDELAALLRRFDVNAFASSMKVYATKP